MKTHISLLLLLGSLFLLAACGQKGPLYLKSEPVAAPVAETSKDDAEKKTDTVDGDVQPEQKK